MLFLRVCRLPLIILTLFFSFCSFVFVSVFNFGDLQGLSSLQVTFVPEKGNISQLSVRTFIRYRWLRKRLVFVSVCKNVFRFC